MRKINPFYSFALILLFAMFACDTSASAVPIQTVDLNAVIAETAAMARTQTALVLPSPSDTPTVTPTFTETNTPTQTVTPIPSFTNTPEPPMISVSVQTNCRNGPGKVYDYQSALVIGKTVEILARESTGNYWYIHDPEAADDVYCWVWGNYATISGDVSTLPMYTPPPTPTATLTSVVTVTPTAKPPKPTKKATVGSFVVSYSNTDACSPNWWVDFKLRNNGDVTFESFNVSVKDMTNSKIFEKKSNSFTDLSGCSTSTDNSSLGPGDILIFSGPNFPYDPTGHLLRISVSLCTDDGQGGSCTKQNFDVQL